MCTPVMSAGPCKILQKGLVGLISENMLLIYFILYYLHLLRYHSKIREEGISEREGCKVRDG